MKRGQSSDGETVSKRQKSSDETTHGQDAEKLMTSEEAEVYDRQIRLWGLEAQEKLRKGVVVVQGLNPLGVEAAKDLALAGINLILLDDTKVEEGDSEINFAISEESIGQKRSDAAVGFLKELNPYISLTVRYGQLETLLAETTTRIDSVVMTCPTNMKSDINRKCRGRGIAFYVASVAGLFGGIFIDLGSDFEFKVKKEDTTKVQSLKYVDWESARDQHWGTVKERVRIRKPGSYATYCVIRPWFFDYAPCASVVETKLEDSVRKVAEANGIPSDSVPYSVCADLSRTHKICVPATCAIVGAILAQEVIKSISHDGVPICNFFLFDGRTGLGQEVNTGQPFVLTPQDKPVETTS